MSQSKAFKSSRNLKHQFLTFKQIFENAKQTLVHDLNNIWNMFHNTISVFYTMGQL